MCQRNKKLPLNTVVHDFIPQIMLKWLEAGSKGCCVEEKGSFPPAFQYGSVYLYASTWISGVCVSHLVYTDLHVMHVCVLKVCNRMVSNPEQFKSSFIGVRDYHASSAHYINLQSTWQSVTSFNWFLFMCMLIAWDILVSFKKLLNKKCTREQVLVW